MAHRALIAYERPDSTYNLHYSHMGGRNLRLKRAISEETPFGSDNPSETLRTVHDQLLESNSHGEAGRILERHDCPSPQVDIEPRGLDWTLDEIVTDLLDYQHYDACYVVDSNYRVTAYRTHWFGLQHDCETIDDSPAVGHGALRTVRWHDGEPVGDGFAQGEFHGLRATVGDMLDRGVFTHLEAVVYMARKLDEWTTETQALIVRHPHLNL
ncbi:DUF6735 family protein [Halosimplex sp. TS25]|uniref:DUF6735 family protein n=1 Tax=Halosimplex rarum TaxID=3396619 RepID=UPI0039E76464